MNIYQKLHHNPNTRSNKMLQFLRMQVLVSIGSRFRLRNFYFKTKSALSRPWILLREGYIIVNSKIIFPIMLELILVSFLFYCKITFASGSKLNLK